MQHITIVALIAHRCSNLKLLAASGYQLFASLRRASNGERLRLRKDQQQQDGDFNNFIADEACNFAINLYACVLGADACVLRSNGGLC